MTIHNAGSLNIDDVFLTRRIVRPGETIPSSDFKQFVGGKGLNQSAALARAGAKVRHVGRIGPDGLFLRERLAADGVDVSGIAVGEEPTGHAFVQVAEGGENAIVLFGGANLQWTAADFDRLLAAANPGDILLMQNEINMIPELMKASAAAGLRLAMNPAPMGPEVKNYPLDLLSWLLVNEIEARELAALDSASDEAVMDALRRRCPQAAVVITFGKRGALRADAGSRLRASFPDQGPVVDTTGAGDTFTGYFLAAEAAALNAKSGLRRACAAGAIAVTRPGAAAGIPSLGEVLAVL